uniref:Multiple coagulation factor deficiency protein 2 homolog (Trinotate prediction) n=1 Tax=Myxobolus squamalis TaxID=59785 RepID=A0A6B2G5J2_MYXSQ
MQRLYYLLQTGMYLSLILLCLDIISFSCFSHFNPNDGDVKHFFLRDVDHLEKHLGSQVKKGEISDTKASMLNFRVHDSDKNDFLDGLELRRLISHYYEDHTKELLKEDQVITMIDKMIKMADLNNDKLISYSEYIKVIP